MLEHYTAFLTLSEAAFFVEHVAIGLMLGRKADEGGLALNDSKKATNLLPNFWMVFSLFTSLVGFFFEHHTDVVAPTLYNVLAPIVTVVNTGFVGRLFYVDYQSIDKPYKTAAKICM